MENINQRDELCRRQGLWFYYHENGCIHAKETCLNDLLHGERIFYYMNGFISSKSYWFNGGLINYEFCLTENAFLLVENFKHIIF